MNSELVRYIVATGRKPGDRLPSLEKLSAELKLSIGKLREQLEVARALGFVEVRPNTGIRVAEYNFLPAIRYSLLYALAQDPDQFAAFGELRNHVEAAFWFEAVACLTPQDHAELRALINSAWDKLNHHPVQIPHAEHRSLHLTFFKHLNNAYVIGVLEAYWEAYEAVGLSLFSDYEYLREVWTYHEGMVTALAAGDPREAHRLLLAHTSLLRHRELRSGGAALTPAAVSAGVP
ncbi:MAG: FadR family transcriptional regulator [Anaerolineales bacterium]|nr:FadR family transcriptional regulator [Anaerolineales bacterium]